MSDAPHLNADRTAIDRLDHAINELLRLRDVVSLAREGHDCAGEIVGWQAIRDWVEAHRGIAACGANEAYRLRDARGRGEDCA